MFIQVIQGQVTSATDIRTAFERWMTELAPGATGWLGSTAGVTEAGEFIALARFDSEESAMRNSERPEQDAWWQETSKAFSGEVTFKNSTFVDVDTPGDPARAGFVQVIQGQSSNPARGRELMMQGDRDEWASFRPDILGSVSVEHEGGEYTVAIYFTSEAEAREGEQKEPPEEIRAAMEEMNTLSVGEPTFLDLKDPWLHGPT